MNWFCMTALCNTAVTHIHKCNGLTQIDYLSVPECKVGLTGLKARCQQARVPSGGSGGEPISVPLLA